MPLTDNGSPRVGALQHHEHPIRHGPGRAFDIEVVSQGGEEPVRDRDQALMAALALSDEQPALARAHILKAQAQDLRAAQPSEQHRFDHGPITPGP